jgi:hypothetical protein
MIRYACTCLLLGTLAWGQAPMAAPPAQKPGTPAGTSAFPGDAKDQEAAAAKVAPDAPVITVDGLCADKSAGTCKTVITREQFEKLVDAIQPNMPVRARRQFANRYANALVMSQKAHDMGLDQGPKFEQRLQLARVQILSQSLSQAIQEKAGQISDQDIQDYFDKNKAEFQEATLHRIFIPRVQQQATSKIKLSEAEEAKRSAAGEAAMKAEAQKMRAGAAAGGDLNKLQEEAFQVAGIKAKSPTTDMGKVRRSSLPPNQAAVMDLKTGAVSELLSDQSGYFVYKVGAKDAPTVDGVKEEIRGTLRSQRMQDEMQAVEKSATPALDEAYFGPEGPQRPMPPMPGMGQPGQPRRP